MDGAAAASASAASHAQRFPLLRCSALRAAWRRKTSQRCGWRAGRPGARWTRPTCRRRRAGF